MPAAINLIGMRFGKLTVVSQATSDHRGTRWNCECSCENKTFVPNVKSGLRGGDKKTCGCLRPNDGSSPLAQVEIGKMYGALMATRFEYFEDGANYYLFHCDCGRNIIRNGRTVKSGMSVSCGCKINKQKKTLETKLAKGYDPQRFSAKTIWKMGTDEEMEFSTFVGLAKQNCHYCHSGLSNIYNQYGPDFNSQFTIDNGWFKYNGVDRIDSNLGHVAENCVPCCHPCNWAKSNYKYMDFLNRIIHIRNNSVGIKFDNVAFDNIDIPIPDKRYMIQSLKKVWSGKIYNRQIPLNQFYNLTQLPCFYCKDKPKNCCNVYRARSYPYKESTVSAGDFIYNGLDRLDVSKKHTIDNVVPCCRHCNRCKFTRTPQEFIIWVENIYQNIINNKLLETDIKIFNAKYLEIGKEKFKELGWKP